MIKQMPSGQWRVEGIGPLVVKDEAGKQVVGEAAVVVPNAIMQQFIHDEAQKLADRALKILIEHQRHTLLPEEGKVCSRCEQTWEADASVCRNCGNTIWRNK